MRALVTDDSRAMRRIITGMLTDAGLVTTEAGHGREALDLLEAHGVGPDGFELICIDWNMPVMDGLELVGHIRRRREWRALTMMMITSESEHSQVVRALAAGAHEYLVKPFTAEQLRAKIALLGLVEARA
ncbi:response regulator [Georgenia thermotolerans]|uniref:Response regulator n=1 Tax=Georgenia thermotolerans TaxID=527326 RepID=A0A7J5UK23_9MICO|nr:response regulator [Georgenia thermotolerans]KAE8762738.1 response regulator [Georgenia thermotolerans]